MAITKVRKNYHQARWDEPMIFELSTPGVRGIIPPAPEAEIVAAVGDVAGGLPESIRRSDGPGAARGRPEARARALPAPLAGDARLQPARRHEPGHLHDEVQPAHQRRPGGRSALRRRASLAGRRHHAGHPRDLLRVRADHEGGLGHGPLHAAAGRRRPRRVHRRLHDPRLPPRPRRGGAAQRGHHDACSRTRATRPRRPRRDSRS